MSVADEFAKGLVEMGENIAPMLDFAEGQRAVLEKRGWSPTAAEAYALELLLAMTRNMFNPQRAAR